VSAAGRYPRQALLDARRRDAETAHLALVAATRESRAARDRLEAATRALAAFRDRLRPGPEPRPVPAAALQDEARHAARRRREGAALMSSILSAQIAVMEALATERAAIEVYLAAEVAHRAAAKRREAWDAERRRARERAAEAARDEDAAARAGRPRRTP